MVGLKRGLLAAAAVSALLLHTGRNPAFYDAPGGVNMRFMNQRLHRGLDDLPKLEYLASADKIEHNEAFELIPLLKKAPGAEKNDEFLYTLFLMEQNYRTLCEVDNKPRNKLRKPGVTLKDLLDDLHSIDSHGYDDGTRLWLMYNRINKSLSRSARDSQSRTLLQAIEMGGGDCNDLSAAHASIYNYFRYDAVIMYGIANNMSTGNSTPHAWLKVKIDGVRVDLDPTWYDEFAPLEPRPGETVDELHERIISRIMPH